MIALIIQFDLFFKSAVETDIRADSLINMRLSFSYSLVSLLMRWASFNDSVFQNDIEYYASFPNQTDQVKNEPDLALYPLEFSRNILFWGQTISKNYASLWNEYSLVALTGQDLQSFASGLTTPNIILFDCGGYSPNHYIEITAKDAMVIMLWTEQNFETTAFLNLSYDRKFCQVATLSFQFPHVFRQAVFDTINLFSVEASAHFQTSVLFTLIHCLVVLFVFFACYFDPSVFK